MPSGAPTVNASSPSRRPVASVVAAALVAGVALWLSRASFDVAGTGDAPMRVAMLPALPELAGLIVLALLIAAAIASLLGWDAAAADVLAPLFSLALLALPYLPWLPDWLPALRLLAGPGRSLVWMIVLGQLMWLLGIELTKRIQAGPGPSFSAFAIFVTSLCVYVWALSRAGAFDALPIRLIAAAAVAVLVWWSAYAVTRSKTAATFAWASICFSAPFLLNARHLVPGAFIDLFTTIRNLTIASPGLLTAGVPGVLFDQEFGVFAYAPVLLLGFVGLTVLARDRSRRLLALALGAAVLGLIGLAGSRDPWWNDALMPGATVLLALPLLAPPIAWLYARTGGHTGRRTALQILLLLSLAVTLSMVHDVSRVPLPQEGDGSSSLLQWFSPTWQLWDDAPSFIASAPLAWARTTLWLVAAAILGWLISRRTGSPGRAHLFAITVMLGVFVAAASISAAVLRDERTQRFDPEARVLFPMLETFTPVVRPIGVRYDPFSVVNPAELTPLFSLTASPGQRLDRQPVRVVLNARFRLPAGQYQVDMQGSDLAGTVPRASVALQVGREGRPLETWRLQLMPGSWAQYRFRLPLDAEFVGFRASRQVEQTIAALRISALQVEDVPRRFDTPTLLSAADFKIARVFFHDSGAYTERDGFWVKGRATIRMTILKAREADSSLTLAIHSGARPNVLTVTTPGWEKRIELVPGLTTRIAVPSRAGETFLPLSITTADGFVPSQIEAGSRDRRVLGAWVAFIPDDISRTSGAP
jgi:hypothetical protein